MYSKLIDYNGLKILIFCTPACSNNDMLIRAKQRYELYQKGTISIEELTGKAKIVTTELTKNL